jgi:hypothetical protein
MKELIQLFSMVNVDFPSEVPHVQPKNVSAFTLEVASLGYTMDSVLISAISGLNDQSFNKVRKELLNTLIDITGSNAKTSNVLFNKFPYEIPYHHAYLMDRIFSYFDNIFDIKPNDYTTLSCGHFVDNSRFDLNDFGACPICQHQVEGLESVENIQHEFSNITPLKVLTLANKRRVVSSLLARNSSLSAVEKSFLNKSKDVSGVKRPDKVYRENLPFVHVYFNDAVYTASLLSGATDVLRIATYMSDENADLSLKDNVKFKFSTSKKKQLLILLEGLSSLEEDMMRHREKWLRIGEKLNPNTAENKKRFPKVSEAFNNLRNNEKNITTFNRTVETAIRSHRYDDNFLATLQSRPSEFIRRLDTLLRYAAIKDSTLVLSALSKTIKDVPTRLLFDTLKYFEYRSNNFGEDRMFFPKGASNKVKIIPENRKSISPDILITLFDVFENEIMSRFKRDISLNATINNDLKNMLLPFNRRGDSSTNTDVMKGSRYSVNPEAKVVRMFIYWKYDTDIDLSMLCLNDKFVYVDQVSFTNTASSGIVHSGDIQRAINGGSEYIDFDIDKLLSRNIRYALMSIISYRGLMFKAIPECFAGFMERDSLRSGAKYEPQSIALKFDVNSESTTHSPIIFDLLTKEFIFADISGGRSSHGSMFSDHGKFAKLVKNLLTLPDRKPTAYDVMRLFAKANHDASAKKAEISSSNITMEEVLKIIE